MELAIAFGLGFLIGAAFWFFTFDPKTDYREQCEIACRQRDQAASIMERQTELIENLLSLNRT